MSTHRQHIEVNEAYFCTVTCHAWLPLFEKTDLYDFIYHWFERVQSQGFLIMAYVIMPNHFHIVLWPTNPSVSLNNTIGEGKRFMAYEIIKRLKNLNYTNLLNQLKVGVNDNERKKDKRHQVFKPSFDARICHSRKMLEQKIEYIHHNPVKGKWNLVSDFTSFDHSSASFYELGIEGIVSITHYRDFF